MTRYEYAIDAERPWRVMVRKLLAHTCQPRGRDQRPWKLYWTFSSEERARDVVARLERAQAHRELEEIRA